MSNLTEQLQLWTDLLDLEDFEVVQVLEDRAAALRSFTLVPRLTVALCPHCGQLCQQRHACHEREVLDLPLGPYAMRLILRLRPRSLEGQRHHLQKIPSPLAHLNPILCQQKSGVGEHPPRLLPVPAGIAEGAAGSPPTDLRL